MDELLREIEGMNAQQVNERLKKLEADVLEMRDAEKINEATKLKSALLERQAELARLEFRNNVSAGLQSGTIAGNVFERTASVEDADPVESAEYRSAWLKQIRGIELNEVESRAWTSAADSAGAAIPTATINKILEKVQELAPILGKIDLLRVKGNVTIPAEGTTVEAQIHAELADIEPDDDTLKKVSLGGFEITKLVTVSKTVTTMSVPAFEAWLVRKLAKAIADKITALMFYGSGSGQPQGIDAIQWTEENSVETTSALTNLNVISAIGMLNGGYDAGAEFYMSKKTFFRDFYPLMDKSKNNLISEEGGVYYVSGYKVVRDDRIKLGEAFLGNWEYGYVGNMPEDVNITSQFVTRNNAFDFLGAAMFDGKVSAVEAFVKIKTTLA